MTCRAKIIACQLKQDIVTNCICRERMQILMAVFSMRCTVPPAAKGCDRPWEHVERRTRVQMARFRENETASCRLTLHPAGERIRVKCARSQPLFGNMDTPLQRRRTAHGPASLRWESDACAADALHYVGIVDCRFWQVFTYTDRCRSSCECKLYKIWDSRRQMRVRAGACKR
jgi:hypothetical protein